MSQTIQWYYVADGEQVGPVSFQTISDLVLARKLVRTSLIWKSDLDDWKKVEELDSLAAFLPKFETSLKVKEQTDARAPSESPEKAVSVHDLLRYAQRAPEAIAAEEKQSRLLFFYHSRSFAGKWVLWYIIVVLVGVLASNFFDFNELIPGRRAEIAPSPLVWWGLMSALNSIVTPFYSIYCFFKNGWGWGLACILIPGVGLVYMIKFWGDCWRAIALRFFFTVNFLAVACLAYPEEFKKLFDNM